MILLIAMLGMIFLLLLSDAWILAWSARLLKSPRGKFTWGLLAVALTGAASIIVLISSQLTAKTPVSPGMAMLAPVLWAIVNVGIQYVILKRVFTLSAGRAFGLLGVYLLWGFAQAALALWVIRPFVTEAYVLPTASMSPTLAPGDCILANKLQRPRRWDIVLYHPPLPDGTVGGDTYCKRLVGLPGERLRVEGGNLYVNDRLVAAPPMVAGRYTMGRYGLHYHDGQTITLAADQLFLIGDSVNKSYDSRFAAAALPEDATCLHHPRKKAVAVCAGTGDYVCSLCAIELNGQTYSAEYLNGPGKNLAGKAFDRMLPRPDSQILFYMLLCFVPYLNVIFIAFAFVWIPHAIYLYVKLLRLRRQNEVLARVVGQGRLITVAILIGLFAVGWIIGAIAIAAVVVRKYG